MFSFWDKNAYFQEYFIVNQIWNKFIVCVWTAMCTSLKNSKKDAIFEKRIFYDFLKNCNFRKLTTDFENRTKFQTETKACVFLDVDH